MAGFSFPPPPPPPPKASATSSNEPYTSQQRGGLNNRGGRGGRGGQRGRGNSNNYRGGSRGRGGYNDYNGGQRQHSDTAMTGSSDGGSRYSSAQQPMIGAVPSQHQQPGYPASPATPGMDQNAQAAYMNNYMAMASQMFANLSQNWNKLPPPNPTIPSPPQPDVVTPTYQQLPNTSSHFPPNKSGPQSPRPSPKHKGRGDRPNIPKPAPAPAVPNFGFQLPVIPTVSTPAEAEPPKKKQRTYNQLGLTPRKEEHEDSEEDVDEEAKFAQSGDPLSVEYGGTAINLKTKEDIAKWIEERKKKYPTRARIEQKERERAEKQAELKKARQAAELERLRNAALAAKGNRAEKQKERKALIAENDADQQKKAMEKHLAKAEKLRKKLQRSEQKAAKLAAISPAMKTLAETHKTDPQDLDHAEAMLRAATAPSIAPQVLPSAPNALLGLAYGSDSEEEAMDRAHTMEAVEDKAEVHSTASSSSSVVSSSDSDSDSDDSNDDESSDSDDAPEAASSRTEIPALPLPSNVPSYASTKIPFPCRYAKMKGGCRNGTDCKYLHPGERPPPREKPEKQDKRKKGPQVKETPRRKTVYDRMVEQEQKEEHMRALQAIKYLGSVGFFE